MVNGEKFFSNKEAAMLVPIIITLVIVFIGWKLYRRRHWTADEILRREG